MGLLKTFLSFSVAPSTKARTRLRSKCASRVAKVLKMCLKEKQSTQYLETSKRPLVRFC